MLVVLEGMNQLIIFSAKYLFVVSFVVVGIYWLRLDAADKKRLAVQGVLGGILALALAKLGGHFINDPRPFVVGHFMPLISHANDNGFPSDHTLITSFLAFAVWPLSRRLSLGLVAIALAVGSARVAAGIHHPLDILGSFVISAVSVLIANEIWTRWLGKSKNSLE